ncbi:hypothetical protein [Dethiobacter alkaliphilus]|uniref:Uncharacterized protein n=1 Tax=Dethiobacter alkaliphilus AHT 1 TaxID=555088 RepID=C0GHZ1_DETAL|nr:hypothetical protein [Dethiobacter alkaliphilus]EEG77065.1 hypothetical protein DealDRAFT_2100 [Dethiobacter alkaliphilus AHT 1]
MTERRSDEDYLPTEENEERAINLWDALGFDNGDEYTPDEMLDIINAKINHGELKLEEIKAALELVGD